MWKSLKRSDKWGFRMSALLICGISLALNISIRHHEVTMEQAPAPQYIEPATVEPVIDKMMKSGECWNGEAPKDASGNVILPTRVIYDGKVRGSKMVDKTLKAIFNDADNGINPQLVSAYCK